MRHHYMKIAFPLSILLLAEVTVAAHADEWRYSVGIHDFNVPDVDSHTYGVTSADAYEYNLDVYQRPGEPAILPWDNDLLIRLTFKTAR